MLLLLQAMLIGCNSFSIVLIFETMPIIKHNPIFIIIQTILKDSN
jgi:hypothetical protein